QDAKFLDGVHGSFQGVAAVDAIDVADAVEQVVVGFGALSVDGVGLTGAQRAAGLGKSRRDGRDAGLEEAELREIAAVEREIDEITAGDDIADDGGSTIDERRFGGYVDDLLFARHAKLDVEAGCLADVELDAALHILREVRSADAKLV